MSERERAPAAARAGAVPLGPARAAAEACGLEVFNIEQTE